MKEPRVCKGTGSGDELYGMRVATQGTKTLELEILNLQYLH